MQYLNYGKCRNLVFFLSPENPRKKCQNVCVNLAYVYGLFLQFITLRASCGTVYCNWSCLFVGECVCLSVCYHDNSKLCASIFTKLGLWVKVVTISSWLNFGHPAPPGRGSAAGRKFLDPPYYSVCVSSEHFFHYSWTDSLLSGSKLFHGPLLEWRHWSPFIGLEAANVCVDSCVGFPLPCHRLLLANWPPRYGRPGWT